MRPSTRAYDIESKSDVLPPSRGRMISYFQPYDFLPYFKNFFQSRDKQNSPLHKLYRNSYKYEIPKDRVDALRREIAIQEANRKPAQMEKNLKAMVDARVNSRRHKTDCGSPEVQIHVVHERIKYLTKHLLKHPHDNACKRGLEAMVNHRRIQLNYLHRKNPEKALEIAKNLEIRYHPPSKIWDRDAKYALFKNTRSKYEALNMRRKLREREERRVGFEKREKNREEKRIREDLEQKSQEFDEYEF